MSSAAPRSESASDILIVAAHQPELFGFQDLLGPALSATLSGLRVMARPVGIGMPAAAVGVSAAIVEHRPRLVVAVGTCGSYEGRGPAIGRVVVAAGVHLASIAAIEGRGGLPNVMQAALVADPAVASALVAVEGVVMADVATTLAITTDDALADAIATSHGCQVEHLEAYSMALACRAQRIPFACVLGVANRVGRRGREQWIEHHLAAGEAAVAVVARWLQASEPAVKI
ncbi:MAG TPA: hypothetical protein VJT73_07245 [Polyangiaceae bacterium]|nr:hypothetical protein [Polyangiaceae bacterium]